MISRRPGLLLLVLSVALVLTLVVQMAQAVNDASERIVDGTHGP